MGSMKGQPTVPTFQSSFSKVKMPQVTDMDKLHRIATSAKLNDVLAKLALGKKK
jgi:hypothetical protein